MPYSASFPIAVLDKTVKKRSF